MKFKGNILITDPCYIIREKNQMFDDDWNESDCGDNFEVLGIKNYITASTGIGDWSWKVFKTENLDEDLSTYKRIVSIDDKESTECKNLEKKLNESLSFLGDFCADAGLTSVFNLDEVRKYNPDIDDWVKTHSWCATILTDFDGEVYFDRDCDGDLIVVGKGNYNFITTF